MKAIITIGIPCSGKSTWAEQFCRDTEFVEINRDNIRLQLFDCKTHDEYKFTKEREKRVTETHRQFILHAAQFEYSIVVSDTSLNKPHREELISYLEGLGYDVAVKLFHVDFFDAIKRNDKRVGKKVPRQVIYDMYRKYVDFCTEIGEWTPYVSDVNLQGAYIVDVDGTIANARDDNGKLLRGFFEWDKVDVDRPVQSVIDVVNTLSDAGNKIIILSGRDGSCQELTEAWLKDHGVQYDEIYMREPGSFEKDRYVKERFFWEKLACRFNVKGVFDDRPQVALLWHDLKIPLFKVGCPIEEF